MVDSAWANRGFRQRAVRWIASPTAAAGGGYPRSKEEARKFFEGLEIVPPHDGAEPDLTWVGLWGADDLEMADSEGSRWLYCAVARRPA